MMTKQKQICDILVMFAAGAKGGDRKTRARNRIIPKISFIKE